MILLNAVPLSAIKNTNEIINTYLFAGDIFMPEMHLKQPELTYSACGLFKRNKEKNSRIS